MKSFILTPLVVTMALGASAAPAADASYLMVDCEEPYAGLKANGKIDRRDRSGSLHVQWRLEAPIDPLVYDYGDKSVIAHDQLDDDGNPVLALVGEDFVVEVGPLLDHAASAALGWHVATVWSKIPKIMATGNYYGDGLLCRLH